MFGGEREGERERERVCVCVAGVLRMMAVLPIHSIEECQGVNRSVILCLVSSEMVRHCVHPIQHFSVT